MVGVKYRNRVITTVAFERDALASYRRAALDAGLDLTAWINKLCARACKPDARKISNRNNKGE